MISSIKIILLVGFFGYFESVESRECFYQEYRAKTCASITRCRNSYEYLLECHLLDFQASVDVSHTQIGNSITHLQNETSYTIDLFDTWMGGLWTLATTCNCRNEILAAKEEISLKTLKMDLSLGRIEDFSYQCHCFNEFDQFYEGIESNVSGLTDEVSNMENSFSGSLTDSFETIDTLASNLTNFLGQFNQSLLLAAEEMGQCFCGQELLEELQCHEDFVACVEEDLCRIEDLASNCSCVIDTSSIEAEHEETIKNLNESICELESLAKQCNCLNEFDDIMQMINSSGLTNNQLLNDTMNDVCAQVADLEMAVDSVCQLSTQCQCQSEIAQLSTDIATEKNRFEDEIQTLESLMKTCNCSEELNSLDQLYQTNMTTLENFLAEEISWTGSELLSLEAALDNFTCVHSSNMQEMQGKWDALQSQLDCNCMDELNQLYADLSGNISSNTIQIQELDSMIIPNATGTSSGISLLETEVLQDVEEIGRDIEDIQSLASECTCDYDLEMLETSLTNLVIMNEDAICELKKRVDCLECGGSYCPQLGKCLSKRPLNVTSPMEGQTMCQGTYKKSLLALNKEEFSEIMHCDVKCSTYEAGSDVTYAVVDAGSDPMLCSKIVAKDGELVQDEPIPCDGELDSSYLVFCDYSA